MKAVQLFTMLILLISCLFGCTNKMDDCHELIDGYIDSVFIPVNPVRAGKAVSMPVYYTLGDGSYSFDRLNVKESEMKHEVSILVQHQLCGAFHMSWTHAKVDYFFRSTEVGLHIVTFRISPDSVLETRVVVY